MNGVLGHNSSLLDCTGPGIIWVNQMNWGMKHAPGARLIIWPAVQHAATVLWLPPLLIIEIIKVAGIMECKASIFISGLVIIIDYCIELTEHQVGRDFLPVVSWACWSSPWSKNNRSYSLCPDIHPKPLRQSVVHLTSGTHWKTCHTEKIETAVGYQYHDTVSIKEQLKL